LKINTDADYAGSIIDKVSCLVQKLNFEPLVKMCEVLSMKMIPNDPK